MSKAPGYHLLRHRAEERLSAGHGRISLLEADTRKLLHELQVHQVELEIQNEELEQAHAECQAALESYTQLYDHAPVAYFTLDRDGAIRRLNLAGAELLRSERPRLAGKRFWRFVEGPDRIAFNDFLKQVFASQARQSCELALHAPGSPQCRSHIRLEAVADPAGETCSAMAVDITALKEAERARQEEEARHRRARQAAERANLAKSHFLAHTSQELRTPLSRMVMLAQLLADNLEGTLTPRQAGYATVIAEIGSDLRHLVDDVVDLAGIEAGDLAMHFRPVAIPDIFGDVRHRYRDIARRKGLAFAIEIDADVPPAIVTDPLRLQQILRSLLSNAIKFTAEGGIGLRVRWAPPAPRDAAPGLQTPMLAFDVADTGTGVAPGTQRAIFELFHPADGGHHCDFDSTGLGLPVARQLAGLLGGTLELASTPGAGSTFTVYLPLAPANTAAD